MPFRCNIINCKGNHSKETACAVFRLPKDLIQQQIWIDRIPHFKDRTTTIENFHVCRKHWPANVAMIKGTGGKFRPTEPPSIFNLPKSCLPTPKPVPRTKKKEFLTQSYFDKKDKFNSFDQFDPKAKFKKYENVIYKAYPDKIMCVFLCEDQSESLAVIKVLNKSTLTCPATFSASKKGVVSCNTAQNSTRKRYR